MRLALLLGLALLPGAAAAHGGLPVSTQLLYRGDSLYVPTQYWGLFVRPGPEGTPWRWICDEAINEDQLRSVYLGGDGTLYATDRLGFTVSRDGGCEWDKLPPPIPQADINALLPDPADPRGLFLTVVQGGQNIIHRSGDNGATFTALATIPGQAMRGLAVAPDGKQVYVTSLVQSEPAAPTLHRSTDGGKSFSALPLTPRPDALRTAPLFVDPRDPDVVYLLLLPEGQNALWRANTRDRTFTEVLRLARPIFSMALDQARDRLFIATSEGLYHIDGANGTATKVTGLSRAQCVSVHNGQVSACSWNYHPDNAAVAASPDGLSAWSSVFQYDRTVDVLSCPERSDVTRECPVVWATYASQLGIDLNPPMPPPPEPGCQAGPGAAPRSLAGIALALSALFLARRHRARAAARAAGARSAAAPAAARSR